MLYKPWVQRLKKPEVSDTVALEEKVLFEKLKMLSKMELREIDEFHYDWEIFYARLIRESKKASPERWKFYSQAYYGVNLILTERRKRFGKVMDCLGFNVENVKHIVALLGRYPARVLDIGCSTGVLVESLLDLGYDAFGIDLGIENVEMGNKRIVEKGLINGDKKPLIAEDFLSLDISSISPCDLIHSNDVLEHIHPDEAREFLERCWKILKSGGWLWLVTPNGLTGPGDATILKYPAGTPSRGLHLKEYTLKELSNLSNECGFKIISSRLFLMHRIKIQTKFRKIYTNIKIVMESIFALLPPIIRREIMGIMNYSTVVARKP